MTILEEEGVADSDVDDEDSEPKRKRRMWMKPRSSAWYDDILLPGSDDVWMEHLRMPRSEIERLAELLSTDMSPSEICVREPVPLLKRVCIAVFKLASCCEYRVASSLFGVSKTTVCRVLTAFCLALSSKSDVFIKFPTQSEAALIADRIEQNYKYIQAFGAIDGSHIAITPPGNGAADYVNRKMHHSLVLQALVDDKYMFRDVSCKCPGSTHDSLVFMNSSLYSRLEHEMPVRSRVIDGVNVPLHILGDPAYSLSRRIIKPFIGSNLTPEQESFNVYHSGARMMVENSFGRLKARWRMTCKKMDCSVYLSPFVVIAACCLHNICESRRYPISQHLVELAINHPDNQQPPTEASQVIEGGIEIRNAIKDYLATNYPLRQSSFRK